MFARRISMTLRPDSKAAFSQRLEKDIIPMLRKQSGFRDELTFIAPRGTEAFGLSLWDSKQHAESYDRGHYQEETKLLAKLIEGTIRVEGYEVANSTFHKVGTSSAVAA